MSGALRAGDDVIGGRFKGGDMALLRQPVARRAKAVVAVGEAAALVKEALTGVVPVIEAESFRTAVERAYYGGGDAFECVNPAFFSVPEADASEADFDLRDRL